jgi:hypothetical protein
MKNYSAVIIILALFGFAISSTSAQLIVNGSFEEPVTLSYTTIFTGDVTISPWVVGLTSVDLCGVNNGFIEGPAFDGVQYIDLNGSPGPGQLTQSFRTRPGSTYLITFAYSNNYVDQPSASADVRIFDALGDLVDQTITHDTAMPGDLHWKLFREQFTARKKNTSFEITSVTESNGGILLDAVSVRLAR